MVELLTVLALLGILVALAAPSLRGMLQRQRTDDAMRRVAADVAYARMLAVRAGASVAVRFSAPAACTPSGTAEVAATQYIIVIRTTPERTLKAVSLRDAAPAVCLLMDRDSLAFNSRGILSPAFGQKILAVDGTSRDSLTISAVGRVRRRY